MSVLAALMLATPIFGFALQPPDAAMLTSLPGAVLVPVGVPASLDALDEGAAEGEIEPGQGDDAADPAAELEGEADDEDEDEYAAQLRRRNDIAALHRPFGIATWAAMTVTLAMGFVQYYNLYGFGAGQGDNPCVKGTAAFGQGQCSGTPWPHLIAGVTTTALYATTFTLSLMMPDPDDLSSGKGKFASRLRLHKTLRWVHFGGMIAQIVLGAVIANVGDRANDYDLLQALATVHLGLGVVTYGALTWAGALMIF
jgi:hypothetical protein